MALDSLSEPPHDDNERDPDGVPHDIVFRVAFAAFVLACAGTSMLFVVGWLGGVLVGIVAIPILTMLLGRRARREREQQDDSAHS